MTVREWQVWCPICKATIGNPCKDNEGEVFPYSIHMARKKIYDTTFSVNDADWVPGIE